MKTQLSIENMHCASCVGRVQQALSSIPGVTDSHANLVTKTVSVEWADALFDPRQLIETLKASGYPATLITNTADVGLANNEEVRTLKKSALVAILMTLPIFLFEMSKHAVPMLHDQAFGWINQWQAAVLQFILCTLVLFGPGLRFFRLGFAALTRRHPDMNSLVAIGAFAAWSFSTLVLFWPAAFGPNNRTLFFEAAAVIVSLILIGRWLEAKALGQAGEAIRALTALKPDRAMVMQSGEWRETALELIGVDDLIRLKPGEKIPVDGVVTRGQSSVDESMITGEAFAVQKSQGDLITAGTINGSGMIEMVAVAIGKDTRLARIIEMVETAQATKLPIQALVDRITYWFVPVVLLIAALTFALWSFLGPSLSLALTAGVSVLIIACPCALGLATPTALMAGSGRAAERGVLFRKGDALQALSSVNVVAFDKTGTLTKGKPEITSMRLNSGFRQDIVLNFAAAVEAASEHPLAHAFRRDDRIVLKEVTNFKSVSGSGVSGDVEGTSVVIGTADYLISKGIRVEKAEETLLSESDGATPVHIAIGGDHAAVVLISDPIREDASDLVDRLSQTGVRTVLISGDSETAVKAVAVKLGIEEYHARVLPEEKAFKIGQLSKERGSTAFLGDGINDGPALAQADIGIAIGTGTDVAIESADVVLVSGTPSGLLEAMAISKATMRTIRQNLFWAFAYNVALIPVAAGLLYPMFRISLSPMLAAAAMAASSVLVVGNALRLRRV